MVDTPREMTTLNFKKNAMIMMISQDLKKLFVVITHFEFFLTSSENIFT